MSRNQDTDKVTTIKLIAVDDKNGNPRSGWLVFATDGELLRFIDGHFGWDAVINRYPNANEPGCTIPVSVSVYRRALGQNEIY